MSTDDFSKIRNSQELFDYLCQKGKRHMVYYQYTTKSVLKEIYTGKSLLLTRADQLNDLAECRGLSPEDKKKTYIASFTFGKMENVAMWFMYAAKPYKDAVRIGFSLKMMNALRNEVAKKTHVMIDNQTRNVKIKSFYFADIVYAHAHYLEYNRQSLLNKGGCVDLIKESDELRGMIKTAPWAYEKEVRLIMTMVEALPESAKSIKIKLPSNFQDGFSVTLGPGTDSKGLSALNPALIFEKSSLTGQISESFTARYC